MKFLLLFIGKLFQPLSDNELELSDILKIGKPGSVAQLDLDPRGHKFESRSTA